MTSRHQNAVLGLFCAILVATLIYLFYASTLRDRVEAKLFDVRTRLAPGLLATESVAIVPIDDEAIAAISGTKSKDLSYSDLATLAKAALATEASEVVLLLPPQILPYEQPGLDTLIAYAKTDPRLLFCTFGLNDKTPAGLPAIFQPIAAQVYSCDISRAFRRNVVRDLEIYRDKGVPYLTARHFQDSQMAQFASLKPLLRDGGISLKLNYLSPLQAKKPVRITATDLLNHPKKIAGLTQDRTLLIGYTTFRAWTFKDREATHVNSPWQNDGDDVSGGIPVVLLEAMALSNLSEKSWLSEAPALLAIPQLLLVTGLSLLIWRLSAGMAAFLFIVGWAALLYLHALIFSLANWYFPLADTLLFSSLATTISALWRLRIDVRSRVQHEAKVQSEQELAQIQDKFLNRFAFELSAINNRIRQHLERHLHLRSGSGTMQKAFARALGSCEELSDYLQGIQQFAALRGQALQNPPLTEVDLHKVIESVVKQFDSRRHEGEIDIDVLIEPGLRAYGDPTLVGQILFNLVSNAIKYSPPKGRITIKALALRAKVEIEVSDTGPGIALEFQERIFDKFYRVKDDYVYKLKGHGLGLYLSRYFANKIQAKVKVKSEVGQGATFSLILNRHN